MKSNSVYILFAWEAHQAAPNRDPFSNALRQFAATGQVYTSEEHLKHHIRRGIDAVAAELPEYKDKNDARVYFMKADETGTTRMASTRKKKILEAFNDPKGRLPKYCLDLPLFGYVDAAEGENFGLTIGSVRSLFFPVTPHTTEIIGHNTNNAFPSKEDGKSSGSNTREVLLYGLFVALLEINLPQLAVNTRDHTFGQDAEKWIKLLTDGIWAAYSSHRFPSVSQAAQFAAFLHAWQPTNPIIPTPPKELRERLEDPSLEITTSKEAQRVLLPIINDYLKELGATKDNTKAHKTADAWSAIGV